jgi:hypothetical protein
MPAQRWFTPGQWLLVLAGVVIALAFLLLVVLVLVRV